MGAALISHESLHFWLPLFLPFDLPLSTTQSTFSSVSFPLEALPVPGLGSGSFHCPLLPHYL